MSWEVMLEESTEFYNKWRKDNVSLEVHDLGFRTIKGDTTRESYLLFLNSKSGREIIINFNLSKTIFLSHIDPCNIKEVLYFLAIDEDSAKSRLLEITPFIHLTEDDVKQDLPYTLHCQINIKQNWIRDGKIQRGGTGWSPWNLLVDVPISEARKWWNKLDQTLQTI